MKTNLLIPALLLLSTLGYYACQKELSFNESEIHSDKSVKANFIGRIIDELGNPAVNVKVSAGNKTVESDGYGIFRIYDITVSEQAGVIKAEKAGYFSAFRTILTNAGNTNFTDIQLIKREIKGSFEAGQQEIVELSEGVFITFNNNKFITKGGTAYTGTVSVNGAFLNPEQDNFNLIMPGDLRAINSSNQLTALKSFGMLSVELEGSAGEKLQLADSNIVSLSMNIPPSLQATAPDIIPLWYFDESKGLWKEEGLAIKTGNIYSGTVSHFSYWNYDVPVDFVYLSLKLKNQNDFPLPYTTVKFINNQDGSYGTSTTDSTGYLKMWVPKAAPLEIQVFNDCNDVLLSKNTGTYIRDEHIGDIKVEIPESASITIIGNAVDCNNNPITNGLAIVSFNGLSFSHKINDGKINLRINDCNQASKVADVFVRDYNTDKQSEGMPLLVNNGEYNAGTLEACATEAADYFRFTFGQDEYELNFPPDSLAYGHYDKETHLYLSSGTINSDIGAFIYLPLTDTVPGQKVMESYMQLKSSTYETDSLHITILKYGKINEYIELALSATMHNVSMGSFPFNGKVRIRRRE